MVEDVKIRIHQINQLLNAKYHLEIGTTCSASSPVRGLKDSCLTNPLSTTYLSNRIKQKTSHVNRHWATLENWFCGESNMYEAGADPEKGLEGAEAPLILAVAHLAPPEHTPSTM